MHLSQNARFVAALPTDPEFDHPPGAWLARRVQAFLGEKACALVMLALGAGGGHPVLSMHDLGVRREQAWEETERNRRAAAARALAARHAVPVVPSTTVTLYWRAGSPEPLTEAGTACKAHSSPRRYRRHTCLFHLLSGAHRS
jgi:hypothetical protein